MDKLNSLLKNRARLVAVCTIPITVAVLAMSFSSASKAQSVSVGRPTQIRPMAMSSFKLIRSGDFTYRLDTKTGVTARFMMTAGYSWKNFNEPEAVAPSEFDIQTVTGNSMIRIDCKTGKTWLMVTNNLVPEWQVVVN